MDAIHSARGRSFFTKCSGVLSANTGWETTSQKSPTLLAHEAIKSVDKMGIILGRYLMLNFLHVLG